MKLQIDEDELAGCVSCGLCLAHCPTYRVTGEEGLSPRGRIATMRLLHLDDLPPDDAAVEFIDSCVQCRGCETACPSGVRFGSLMEGTRATLAAAGWITPRWQRLAMGVLRHHRAVLVGSSVLAVLQRLHLVPGRLGLGTLAVRRPALAPPTGTDTWLFTGCVMDAWQRPTHVSTATLLGTVGVTFRYPAAGAGCCGALHTHAGLHDDACVMAERVIAAMPGDAPIVVNSAGCGAALKEYGQLLGTSAARQFAARVVDVNEFLAPFAEHIVARRTVGPVIVHDPCHLRHAQRVHPAVRTLLGRVAEVVELDDDGLCCGAGGAYAALHPGMAAEIRDRKLASIRRASGSGGDPLVASANPGCAMHLAAAGVRVAHPVDIVAGALR